MNSYDLIAAMSRTLSNLEAILEKAEGFAQEKEIDPEVLMRSRLRPDMLPFAAQIRIACDVAARAPARLTGSELPTFEDDEITLADARDRIRRTLNYIGTYDRDRFDGSEDREIELKLGELVLQLKGTDFLTWFAIPNVYFHTTTAYDLLRFNGLDLGKKDFLGAPPSLS